MPTRTAGRLMGADSSVRGLHFKDRVLNGLAEGANIAQFASFGPGSVPEPRYSRVDGFPANHEFDDPASAILSLIGSSVEHSVNVRSFDPQQPQSNEFVYGLRSVDEADATVRRIAASGLHTIVNETVDIEDGGVSGVSFAGILEFAPKDTPRCVEKPGTVAIARDLGLKLLKTAYGFAPSLDYPTDMRVEFSLHPVRRGYRKEHTIIWEMEQETTSPNLAATLTWPNRFSRFLGDKAFGLLVADSLGLPIPHTVVVARALAPFSFGRHTGTSEPWIRTCPVEPVPGKFTTERGWIDPYDLLHSEDPSGLEIASVLSQEGVDARFSGAALTQPDGKPLIEGVAGTGDEFMVGSRRPAHLPVRVRAAVNELFMVISDKLGPAQFEWVYDGSTVWVVQLHHGGTVSSGRTIYPGSPKTEHRFPVEQGLESLRELVSRIQGTDEGIVLIGDVGVTSHFGDVLRKASVPSHIEPNH